MAASRLLQSSIAAGSATGVRNPARSGTAMALGLLLRPNTPLSCAAFSSSRFSRLPSTSRACSIRPFGCFSSSRSSSLLARPRPSRQPGGVVVAAMGTVTEVMDPLQQRLMLEDECILVDENDNVIGHDSKYNCHLMEKIETGTALHRAFSIFLFNTKHELLLQRRSATKVTFPLVWTNTCCSHPLFRGSELIEDDYLGIRNAAQRKLYDELGIVAEDAPVDQFLCLGRILYKAPSNGKWGEHELDYLLFIVRDVTLHPNPEEVADVLYVNKGKLKELVGKADSGEDGVKLSPWFRHVVDNFLFDWWSKVENGTLTDAADMKTIHKMY
eukprot:c24280_g1_i1 orf=137-1120(+)